MTPQKALLQDFEDDIFINYDHDDNKALTDLRGWVDLMHESLEIRLGQIVGGAPKIWRDNKLTGNQLLTETIVVRLEKTAFLVSVFSPSYINSKWCKRELSEFYLRAALNGGIKINNKSRIFKVVKTPIGNNDPLVDPFEGSDLPPDLRALLRESLGYNFFELDKNGRPREFWPGLGGEFQRKFLERLDDLAQDIREFVINCQKPAENSLAPCEQLPNSGPATEKNIYLAETTPELYDNRNEIKRNLLQHNYHVLPDEHLPFDDDAFAKRVGEYLDRSVLSIHLIGSDHTSIIADEPQTQLNLSLKHQLAADRVRVQHKLAMDRASNDPDYFRLIWMPNGLSPVGENYRHFIAYLQNDAAVHDNAEVLCGSMFEDLKTIIHGKLEVNREEPLGNKGMKRVFLTYDKQDQQAVIPLQRYLESRNYEVLLAFNDGGKTLTHREKQRLCDAFLIFYGSANTVEYKVEELGKLEASRSKPLIAKGVYVAGPETEHKRFFTSDEAVVMKNFGEFSPESMEPFLDQIEKATPTTFMGAIA